MATATGTASILLHACNCGRGGRILEISLELHFCMVTLTCKLIPRSFVVVRRHLQRSSQDPYSGYFAFFNLRHFWFEGSLPISLFNRVVYQDLSINLVSNGLVYLDSSISLFSNRLVYLDESISVSTRCLLCAKKLRAADQGVTPIAATK